MLSTLAEKGVSVAASSQSWRLVLSRPDGPRHRARDWDVDQRRSSTKTGKHVVSLQYIVYTVAVLHHSDQTGAEMVKTLVPPGPPLARSGPRCMTATGHKGGRQSIGRRGPITVGESDKGLFYSLSPRAECRSVHGSCCRVVSESSAVRPRVFM